MPTKSTPAATVPFAVIEAKAGIRGIFSRDRDRAALTPGEGAALLTDYELEPLLLALYAVAFDEGRREGISSLISPKQAAEMLGVSEGRLRQLARRQNVGIRLARDRIFTPADIDTLRERHDGSVRG